MSVSPRAVSPACASSAPRSSPALRAAGHLRARSLVARVLRLVADRLRLPRDALGACPRAPRRRADLPGADPGHRRHRQPDGVPAVLHPRLRPARASSRRRRPRGSGSASSGVGGLAAHVDRRRPRLALPRARASRRPWSSTACSTATSPILLLVPLALAWRYRDRARVAGIAVGVGGSGEALRLAARRVAAAHAALPRRGVGGGVGDRARPRRLGA